MVIGKGFIAAILAVAWIACPCAAADEAAPHGRLGFRADDVVAFVGGETVVRQGESGHLESLLAAANPGKKLRFRNLGWEGDTVFEQPRDLNFPGIAEHLKRVRATVVVAEFGRAESLGGPQKLDAFVAAYEKLCDVLAADGRCIVLMTPAPFERPASPTLPNLSTHNDSLRAYASAVAALAGRRRIACIEVSQDFGGKRFTEPDGLHLTPEGNALAARAAARHLGLDESVLEATADGAWKSRELESLRQAVVEKNRLWFDYWRPMNWAFLGGDRMFTQSSRDPDDLNVRIFPRELEKFVPLIEKADANVEEMAKKASEASKK